MAETSSEGSTLPAALARLVLAAFFHRIEVSGVDRVPSRGPVLFVANHNNALVDPVLILGSLPRRPRFLAKSTLWKTPLLGRIFDWGGVIPVYRRQDEGVDTSRNEETFSRCHEVLEAGGSIALFPEGQSHDEPSLGPLRTGAARIVIGTEQRAAVRGVRIVPLGLLFDDKERFRSRALIVVGEGLCREEGEEARALTDRIDRALREVSPDWPSWERARLVSLAGEIASRPEIDELPGPDSLAEGFLRAKSFQAGLRELEERFPERLEPLRSALVRYDRTLRFFDLRDDQVAASYPMIPILRYLLQTLLRLLLRLPVASLGVVLSWLPYQICAAAAQRLSDAPDEVATYKVYSALLAYPVAWLLEGVVVGWFLGWSWGLATVSVAPVASYLTLDFRDRRETLWREAAALLRLRKRSFGEELRHRRRAVAEQIDAAIELYRSVSS